MMAWGIDCSHWDDSVDEAIMEKYDFVEIQAKFSVSLITHEQNEM